MILFILIYFPKSYGTLMRLWPTPPTPQRKGIIQKNVKQKKMCLMLKCVVFCVRHKIVVHCHKRKQEKGLTSGEWYATATTSFMVN